MNNDLNQLTNLTASQGAGMDSLFSGQNQQTADFLSRYKNLVAGQGSTTALADRIGTELGIPQLRQNALTLRNTLTNLPNTYSKATTGFDVNANQLQRIISTKAGQLAPTLDVAERSLASAEGTLDKRLGYAQNDWVRELMPMQTEEDFMKERFSRETTGYSQQSQNELNALIAKLNAGITLSEGEKNRAQQLAMQEREFENMMKTPQAVGSDTLGFYTPKTNTFANGSKWK